MHKDIIYNTIVRLCKDNQYDLSYKTLNDHGNELDVVHIDFYGEQKEYPFCSWNFNKDFFESELKPFFNKLNKGD